MAHYSNLERSDAAFSQMLGRFGVVTVMDAYVFDYSEKLVKGKNAYQIYNTLKDKIETYEALETKRPLEGGVICKLDTLKVANVSTEGPTKTVTGGKYANTLIKYGKTARLEMNDALGNAEAIEALCGGVVEYETNINGARVGLHNGSDFASAKLIVGKSFFIDQKTGQQINVIIMFYQFNPDSIFNLTQDAEGDATVFDMNGDLLTTDIMVAHNDGKEYEHGVFYSIIDPVHAISDDPTIFIYKVEDGKIILGKYSGDAGVSTPYEATLDGEEVTSGTTPVEKDKAYHLVVKKTDDTVVLDTIIVGK